MRETAWALDVPLATVALCEPGTDELRVVAGVGWAPGVVGTARLPSGPGTAAGDALRSAEPVSVEDMAALLVPAPALLRDHRVWGGIGIGFGGDRGTLHGLLSLYHTVPHAFDESERVFVRTVALVLGSALARDRDHETIRQRPAGLEAYFEAVPVGIAILDAEHRYVRVNARLAALAGRTADALVGQAAVDINPMYPSTLQPYVARVFSTGVPHLNHELRIATGADPSQDLDWLVSYVPIAGEAGAGVEAVSVVVQDVTPLKRAQAALEELTGDLEQRVAERTRQVRQLSADLTHAEQGERRRVAQILHDDLQQLLFGLQMKVRLLGKAADADLEPLVRSTDALLDQAIETTRSLTVDLSPPVLAGEGVDRSIEWLALRMEDVHGLRTVVRSEGDTRAAADVQTLLFQLVRELLFNVVKHSGQARAAVAIRSLDGHLHIEVSDAGSGFDPERPRLGTVGGFGLVSVRERLRLVGGSMEIASRPGEGTTVTIEAPANPLSTQI